MKRFHFRTMFLGFLLLCSGSAAFAYDYEAEGIFYNLIEGQCAVVTSGDETTYADTLVIPVSITVDEVEYQVTGIDAGAFKDCSNLLMVVFPESLQTVGEGAFAGCINLSTISVNFPLISTWLAGITSLKEIILGENVQSIESNAFKGCTGLTTINLPDGLTAISDGTFDGCSSLLAITIPETVTTIGNNAFRGCTSLESLTLTANLTDISPSSFSGCTGLTTANISIPVVGTWFAGLSGLQEVKLADEVTGINDGAFKNCTSLTTINIPEDLKTIGENAFNGCSSLASIVIPANATVPVTAFKGCTGLKIATINTAEVQTWFAGLSGLQEVNLADEVTSISDGAFKNCTSLTTINIPEDLKTIGENAFNGCSSLASIVIPTNAIVPVTAFKGCIGLKTATINTAEVQTWFAGLSGLQEVKLADEVTGISDGAFKNCTSLTTINIPEDLKTIGENAFNGCSSLASIVIPANAAVPVTAFKGCTGLTSATINTREVLNWFAGLISLSSVTLSDEVTSLVDGAFKNCTALTSINFPDDLLTIGENAFYGCSSLASIYLPTRATVPVSAFKGCTGLTSVTINTNEVLAWFSNLTKLTDVTLGEEVLTIAKQAFYNCSGLTTVNLTEGLREIGSWAFGKCTKLNMISIPDGVTTIGDFAFEGCQSLTSIYINTQVIAPWFAGLESVKEIVIGDNVTEIEAGAFARMTSLQNVTLGSNVVSIDNTTFPTNVKIYTVVGGKSLLALWAAGYDKVYEIGTTNLIQPTTLSFVSSTQTTASFLIDNIYPGYELSCEGRALGSAQLSIQNLCPESEGECTLDVTNEGVAYHIKAPYTTQPMNVKVVESEVSPTAFTAEGSYNEGDAVITSRRMTANRAFVDGDTGTFTGLDPQKSYTVTYTVTVAYGEEGTETYEFSDSAFVFTSKIALTTMPAKVVSAGEVIVAAQTNIKNDEEKVGFEWRRTDAPSSVESHSGEAILFEGAMEGFLHNLTSTNFWNYRPYYESKSGKKYFGEWGTVEADDYSYFEPTVHTYAKIEVVGNEAEVQGYAMPGSDDVTEQGFEYWENNANVKGLAPSMNEERMKVLASGQRMTASLTNLNYDQTYCYVAFMTTSKGQTYYGEVHSFTTGAPVGIREIADEDAGSKVVTVVARYDLQGRRINKPVRGVNVLRMSDGTTRKVIVK